MEKLFKQQDFDNSPYLTKFPLRCVWCQKVFYLKKSRIQAAEKNKKHKLGSLCSIECFRKYSVKKQKVNCKNCNKEFEKLPNQIKRSLNHFCCKSCAATYNNAHKTMGTRISKLEIWLQKQLTLLYPDLEIHYNRKDAINSELDIYIPSLKLAFELNGIFHFEPIYGEEKLNQIQNNDSRKFLACAEKQISLCLIDTSSQKNFKLKTSQKFLDIIINTINNLTSIN